MARAGALAALLVAAEAEIRGLGCKGCFGCVVLDGFLS